MGSQDSAIDIDTLERHLLSNPPSNGHAPTGDETGEDEPILYTASFEEMEDKFMKYQITKWVLCSLILILAWGIGLLMLLYLPIRIYISKKEFRSKKLYLTPHAIIYKENKPVFLPCFGATKREKYIILPSVADVIIEQGFLQHYFGIFSIRVENCGVRRASIDGVNIQGVSLPIEFQKEVLKRVSRSKDEGFGKQLASSSSSGAGEMLLKKLEEVESSLKKVHALMETRSPVSTPVN